MWKTFSPTTVGRLIPKVLCSLFLLSVSTRVIESFAGVGGRERVADLTSVLLEQPLFFALFGVWAVIVWRKFFDQDWTVAIERVLRYSPFLLVSAFVNAGIAWLGFEAGTPSFVNILEAPVALLTFGWLPRPLASSGVLTVLIIGVVLFLRESWRRRLSFQRIVLAALMWLVGSLGILLLPSILSWVIVSGDVSPLNAGPNILARSWVALVQESYWWRSIVDRFPGTTEGEAIAAVRLLKMALVWLGTVVLIGVVIRVKLRRIFQEIVHDLHGFQALSFLGAGLFGVWIGSLMGGDVFKRAVDVVAVLLFLLTILVSWWWMEQVGSRLEGGVSGEREGSSWAMGGVGIAGVSGWLLGWPVLLAVVSAVALQVALHAEAMRWKNRWFSAGVQALSQVFLVAAGVFFALRTAAVPVLTARIWLSVAIFYLLQSLPLAFTWSQEQLAWIAQRLHAAPRLLVSVVLAMSYLVFPLISGWSVVWWVAVPFAVVALLPLLGTGRWDVRKMIGWQIAFLFLTFLLLAVYPPR